MIAGLKGKFVLLGKDSSGVLVMGFCSGATIYEVEIGPLRDAVSVITDSDVWIYTWQVIREDSQVLYGFLTPEARALAISMAEADGIGPKLASLAVQTIGVSRILGFINTSDTKGLQAAMKGLGTKRAAELVSHLRNSMTWVAVDPGASTGIRDAEITLAAMGHKVDVSKLAALVRPGLTAVQLVQRYLQA